MKQKEKEALQVILFAAITNNKTDFERGITYICTLIAKVIDGMPTEPDEPEKPESEPVVFGKWYKPEERMPDNMKDVLVELNTGIMAIWHYNEVSKAWYGIDNTRRSSTVERWCCLPV